MPKVDEIKEAIEALPEEEYVRLRQWFLRRTDKNGIDRLRKTQSHES